MFILTEMPAVGDYGTMLNVLSLIPGKYRQHTLHCQTKDGIFWGPPCKAYSSRTSVKSEKTGKCFLVKWLLVCSGTVFPLEDFKSCSLATRTAQWLLTGHTGDAPAPPGLQQKEHLEQDEIFKTDSKYMEQYCNGIEI